MSDDASNELPPKEATRAMVEALKRLMQARSFAAGLSHLAGRRARMEATCARVLTLTPTDFARVMNAISPGQYLKHPMSVEAAAIVLARYSGMPAADAASELADLVETAQEWTPHKLNAFAYFDALHEVEVKGYARNIPSAEHHNDHTIRMSQQARRWLGQNLNESGKPKRGRPKGATKTKPDQRMTKQEQRKSELQRRKLELERRTSDLLRASRAKLGEY